MAKVLGIKDSQVLESGGNQAMTSVCAVVMKDNTAYVVMVYCSAQIIRAKSAHVSNEK